MDTLHDLFNYMVSRQNSAKECKLLGEGSYSLVWDFGEDAYKLTNELSSNNAFYMQEINNKLQKLGVKVPKINQIDVFKCNSSQVISNLKSFCHNLQGKQYYKTLNDFSKGFDTNKGNYNFLGIRQQKINGVCCFCNEYKKQIALVNKITTFNDNSNLHPSLIKLLEDELQSNLQFFNSISTQNYINFIKDGASILKAGLYVDNTLQSNFMYAPDGFYFIDLDGLKNSEISADNNVFDFTINNICAMVYSKNTAYSKDLAKQQLMLAEKLIDATNQCLQDEYISQMFTDYKQTDNNLKKLINTALQVADEKTAKQYVEKLKIDNSIYNEKN